MFCNKSQELFVILAAFLAPIWFIIGLYMQIVLYTQCIIQAKTGDNETSDNSFWEETINVLLWDSNGVTVQANFL